jgi:hypothetical protein
MILLLECRPIGCFNPFAITFTSCVLKSVIISLSQIRHWTSFDGDVFFQKYFLSAVNDVDNVLFRVVDKS